MKEECNEITQWVSPHGAPFISEYGWVDGLKWLMHEKKRVPGSRIIDQKEWKRKYEKDWLKANPDKKPMFDNGMLCLIHG